MYLNHCSTDRYNKLTLHIGSGVDHVPEPAIKVRKISQLFNHDEPTIVHRAQFKSRPSLIEPSTSPSTTTTSSGKSSDPRPAQSTGKTSLDSKFSSKSVGATQRSSENKKAQAKVMPGDFGSSAELAPIAEVDMIDPEPVPSEYPD
jgi:hypothetical protein